MKKEDLIKFNFRGSFIEFNKQWFLKDGILSDSTLKDHIDSKNNQQSINVNPAYTHFILDLIYEKEKAAIYQKFVNTVTIDHFKFEKNKVIFNSPSLMINGLWNQMEQFTMNKLKWELMTHTIGVKPDTDLSKGLSRNEKDNDMIVIKKDAPFMKFVFFIVRMAKDGKLAPNKDGNYFIRSNCFDGIQRKMMAFGLSKKINI